MDVKGIIEQYSGKKVLSTPEQVELWEQWYKGDVESFHNYNLYNGEQFVKCKRKTLNMPKKICEDWANLLLNEKTDIAYGDEEQQQALWDLLNKVSFWTKGNLGIEKSFAFGTGAFVESVTENKEPKLQFVNRSKIYPITVEDDQITECAFANINSNSVVIQIHLKENGNYVIKTLKGTKQNDDITIDAEDFALNGTFNTGSDIPWFQIVKPNIVNNINLNSPMGISIFANAVDVLQGVDLAYDGFCSEMRLGKARIFVDTRLVRYENGAEKPIFDNNDEGFYQYGNGENEAKDPLKFYNPPLRTDGYFAGINNTLNLLSSKCGFGENHYRYDINGLSTATQVISENSELFRTLKKHEILLNDTIIGVCKALMYISNEYTDFGTKFDLDANIEVKFDDSIIEDKASEKENDRRDVSLGVMSKAEFRSKWYNEDLDTAKANIEAISQESGANIANFFSGE